MIDLYWFLFIRYSLWKLINKAFHQYQFHAGMIISWSIFEIEDIDPRLNKTAFVENALRTFFYWCVSPFVYQLGFFKTEWIRHSFKQTLCLLNLCALNYLGSMSIKNLTGNHMTLQAALLHTWKSVSILLWQVF